MPNLVIRILGDSGGLRAALSAAERDLSSFSARTTRVGVQSLKYGMAAGFTAVTAAATVAVKRAVDFERGMREINTLARLSERDLGAMSDGVRQVAKDLGISLPDAVRATYDAVSARVPPDNVVEFLRTAGELSIATLTDLDTAVDGLTSVFNAYNLKVEDMTDVSDKLFKVVELGKIRMPELAYHIGKIAPVASAAGVSLAELTGIISRVVQVEKPEEGITVVRELLFEMAKQGKSLEQMLRQYSGANLQQINAGGIERRAARALAILASDLGKTNEAIAATEASSGATSRAMGEMADTADRRLKVALAEANDIAITFGSEVLPGLVDGIRSVDMAFKDAAGEKSGLASFGQMVGSQLGNVGYLLRSLATFRRDVRSGGGGFVGEALRAAGRYSWVGRTMARANAALVEAPFDWLFTRQARKDADAQAAADAERFAGLRSKRPAAPAAQSWSFGGVWNAIKRRADDLERVFMPPDVEKAWSGFMEDLDIQKLTGETTSLSEALRRLGVDSALTFGIKFSGNAKVGTEVVKAMMRSIDDAAKDQKRQMEDAAEAAEKLNDKLRDQRDLWEDMAAEKFWSGLADDVKDATTQLRNAERAIASIEDAISDLTSADRSLVDPTAILPLVNDPRARRDVRRQVREDERFADKVEKLRRGERPFLTPKDKARLRELGDLGIQKGVVGLDAFNARGKLEGLDRVEGAAAQFERARRDSQNLDKLNAIAADIAELRKIAAGE